MREPIIRNVARRSTNPVPPPQALLCERCGYVLDGLPVEGHCPECGKPIGESQPANRPGTAWQLEPSVRTWFVANLCVFLRTRWMMSRLRVPRTSKERRLTTLMMWLNCGIWLLPVIVLLALIASVRGVVSMLALKTVLVILTEIEAIGLCFLARRRKWRVSWPLARAICAHAAIGWLGLLPCAVMAFVLELKIVNGDIWGRLFPWPGWLTCGLIIIGLLLPMLCFETLAYLGLRACKYANSDPSNTTNSPAQQSPRP